MGKKPGKWLRNFLTGKKDNHKEKCNNGDQNSLPVVVEIVPTTPISIRPTTPKEKRRWSFRRLSAARKDSNSNPAEPTSTTTQVLASSLASLDCEDQQKKHEMAMEAATAVAAEAAAAVIRLTSASAATNNGRAAAVEEAAATKIQSVFRSYLARKALCALRGLVKLQALVRGHLVRKQATATLKCMQALVTAQARARAQRIRMVEDGNLISSRPPSPHRKSTHQENRYRHSNYEIDKGMEENIKIVEMDQGDPSRGAIKGRNSYSHNPQRERPTQPRLSAHYPPSNRSYSKQDVNYLQASPAPSAITDFSPRACSSHFEDLSFGTAQSSPQCYSAMSKPDPSCVSFAFQQPDYSEPLSYDYPLFPNYMANTQSSRAKVRSQSAPKQRPSDSLERQLSRRRISLEGRIVPRAVRMQRSSSQAGSVAQNYQYPWSIKLDRSVVSLKDSECGSTSTVLTNANYCRSLVGFDIHGERY